MDVAVSSTAQVAAERVAAFLRRLGHPDVSVAHPNPGPEVEVRAGQVVAVVAVREQPVDNRDLQRLTGIAAVDGCRGASFAGGYTREAVQWALRAGLALFTLDATVDANGEITPANALAVAWLTTGGLDGQAPAEDDTPAVRLDAAACPSTDEPALRAAAVEGEAAAMTGLGRHLLGSRRLTEATLWYRRAVEAGNADAWQECGDLLLDAGAAAHLEAWCRDFAATGHPGAMLALADLHAAAGDVDAEVEWLSRCVDAGRSDRALRLGRLHEEAGRREGALRAYQTAADAGEPSAARHVARLVRDADPEAAESSYRRAAEAGDLEALHELALLLTERGRNTDALSLLRRGADLGSTASAIALGRLLFEAGEVEEGETWLRVAGEAGASSADDELTQALEARLAAADADHDAQAAQRWRAKLDGLGTDRAWMALGHRAWRLLTLDEAVAYFRKVAERGDVEAMIALADVLRQMDNVHEAYDWYLKAAQLDHSGAMLTVGELLFGWNLIDKAVVWLERAHENGHPRAAQAMADHVDEAVRRAERLGDGEVASRFLARLRSLETVPAFRLLAARAYADHDDRDYEQWLRRAAEDGDGESMADLGKHLWLKRNEGEEAREWCRRAVEAGHWQALYVLDHLLGPDGEAAQERVAAWRRSAEAGWLPGLEWMTTRGAATDEERERWAAAAAEAGSSVAYLMLGQLALRRGDTSAAQEWFGRGAAEEDRDAMYNLGLLRLDAGDVADAKRWFLDAAGLEHKESADRLVALLKAETTPDRELISLWEKLFTTASDKQEAAVARSLSAAYHRRGDERVAARLAELAAGLR
jgi:TPR repeat protein